MGCSGAAPAWRSAVAAAVALCLLPVVVPVVLFLCLPLLCFAVAVVRFRRRRRRIVTMKTRGSSCFFGDRWPPSPEGGAGPPHRTALLRKYLQDQMELVEAEAGGASKESMGSVEQETDGTRGGGGGGRRRHGRHAVLPRNP